MPIDPGDPNYGQPESGPVDNPEIPGMNPSADPMATLQRIAQQAEDQADTIRAQIGNLTGANRQIAKALGRLSVAVALLARECIAIRSELRRARR